MANLNPKIEIINHFDELINRIDIDIEESIEKYKDKSLGMMLKYFATHSRNHIIHQRKYYESKMKYFDCTESSSQSETVIEWSESTKVVDYLTQVRQKTIAELRKAEEESLEYLKSESCNLKHLKESKDVEEMKSRLFADKFYFQVHFHILLPSFFKKPKEIIDLSWIFNLFTIVVDFYLSPSEIKFLELLINSTDKDEREVIIWENKPIFDEKSLLIHGIRERLFENLQTQKYPNHVINIRKQDLLNIKTFSYTGFAIELNLSSCSIYLSNLERLEMKYKNEYFEKANLEELSSLKSLSLHLASIEGSSFGNMHSLKQLDFYTKSEINNDFITKLSEICPNIEELILTSTGQFTYINLDRFVKLKNLSLFGNLSNDFNLDLFANISNRLEELCIQLHNIDDESMSKLLFRHFFPNLSNLNILHSKITRLEKKLFEGFPMLQSLKLFNNRIKTIDKEAFSNLKNLKNLDLSLNRLSELDPDLFSCLVNLECLKLEFNKLRHFDLKSMDYIVNIKEMYLSHNPIENIEEIRNRLKQSVIKFRV